MADEMNENDFLQTLNVYTKIQHLLGIIKGAASGIENQNMRSAIANAAGEIKAYLDDVFAVVQVIDDDEAED